MKSFLSEQKQLRAASSEFSGPKTWSRLRVAALKLISCSVCMSIAGRSTCLYRDMQGWRCTARTAGQRSKKLCRTAKVSHLS